MDAKTFAGEANRSSLAGWIDKSPHRSAFVAGDGVRLNYLDWGGNGPPLVMIHGIANSPHIFDESALLLTDHFRVLAYARRGHGQSDAPSGPYDFEALVSDLRHLLDNLGIERIYLLGWSMGGDEITEFAGRYPERVEKLVYLEGGYDWSDASFFEPSTKILAVNSADPATLRSLDDLEPGIAQLGSAAMSNGRARSKRFCAMPCASKATAQCLPCRRSRFSRR